MAEGAAAPMIVLGIDTATEACSLALSVNGAVLRRFERGSRNHGGRLRPLLGDLLAEAGCRAGQIDGFACGIGPGSFAGVRVGVAFIQGMATALDRPTIAFNSLELLALGAPGEASSLLSAIDARMGEVYFAAYRREAGELGCVVQPMVVAPTALASIAGEWALGLGSGWAQYGDVLAAAVGEKPAHIDGEALPDIADGLALASRRLAAGEGLAAGALRPLYLRERVALTLVEQAAAKSG